MPALVLLAAKLLGTLATMARLFPEFLEIIHAFRNVGMTKDLVEKLKQDKEKIENAFQESDPEKRSAMLNDIFRN